jgi:hypothetical protein
MSAQAQSPHVPAATLAKLFEVTAQRIHQLAADGILVKAGRGQFELWPSVRNYIRFLRERKVNQYGGGKDTDEKDAAQVRLTKAKAEIAEMNAARMRGESLEAETVERFVGGMVMDAKVKLEAFAHKLSGQLEGADTLPKRHAIIDAAVTDVLNELSKFDTRLIVDDYVATHRELVEAQAEADAESVG